MDICVQKKPFVIEISSNTAEGAFCNKIICTVCVMFIGLNITKHCKI